MSVGHLHTFFGKLSVQVFCLFFNWVLCFLILSCMCCLYILDIHPLSFISFANIFSHSVGCLFILLMVSFAVQKNINFLPFIGTTKGNEVTTKQPTLEFTVKFIICSRKSFGQQPSVSSAGRNTPLIFFLL